MQTYQLDVVATRGGVVESRHRVHAAIVDASGHLLGKAREPSMVTFWRSCAKPFQVMQLLESGGFDRVRWGDDQLAIACASHGGEPEHVAIAASMLHDLEMEEGDLVCGPHEPLTARGAKLAREAGRLTRLHNNCSGKHAAMLASAYTVGWPTSGYARHGHPVQDAALASISRWSDVAIDDIGVAVDGCGVVVHALPLAAMALAYARLGKAAADGEDVASRIAHAMRTRPFLVAGTDRFDTILIEETAGHVLSKVGAEGVHSVAIVDAGIGIAVKSEDGTQRAQYPAVLRLLQELGALPATLPPRLAEYLVRPVRNSRGEVVGEVRPAA
jgi:L-asparaginase II